MVLPAPPRLPVLLLSLLAGVFLWFVGAVTLGLLGVALPGWFYDQLPLTVSYLSAGGAWWARWHAPPPVRRAWTFFAAGLTAYALGDTVYNLYKYFTPGGEPPFPSWADALYMLYAPLLCMGLWPLLRPTAGHQQRRLLLDIGTIVITMLVVLWHFLFAGEVQDSGNLVGLLVNLSYPLQDSAMCSLVLIIAFQQRVSLPRAAIRWLTLAFVATFISDVAYAALLPEPYSLLNQLMDIGFLTSQLSFSLAAIWSVARPGETRVALPPAASVLSPYAAILVCFGLLVWQIGAGQGGQDGAATLRLMGDVVGTGLVTLVVVLRQNLAFRENAELTGELSEHAGELERRATHDALTGLPNRALLELRLQAALAQAAHTGRQVGVLYLDLDRFKTINDGLGHEVGDLLLMEVSRRLRLALRPGDTLARQGGDEFMVVMPELDSPEQAEALARRLAGALGQPITVAGRRMVSTASLGLALYPRDGLDSPTLRKHADVAMYRAKANGRNALRQFSPEMSGGLGALELEQALREAVQRGEFELHYQPQVRPRSSLGSEVRGIEMPEIGVQGSEVQDVEVLGLEALVRWRRGRELVPPGVFIPLAEETGLIVPLGEWVLRESLRQLAQWERSGLYVARMAVNVSARQLAAPGLPEAIQRALVASGITPDRLELELTESLMAENLDAIAGQLAALRSQGLRVAVDDFGTGHSSLALLRAVPADTLKIDRAFVSGLPADRDSVAVVRVVLALAHTLGLDVVAEGVETSEQWSMLGALGCTAGQGFAFARPLPAAGIEQWLRSMAGFVTLPLELVGLQPS